ncbi:hypothetical protein D3C71_1615260 [compost metagenome]
MQREHNGNQLLHRHRQLRLLVHRRLCPEFHRPGDAALAGVLIVGHLDNYLDFAAGVRGEGSGVRNISSRILILLLRRLARSRQQSSVHVQLR